MSGDALLDANHKGSRWRTRAEIDTSAPFESVQKAVDHFGGSSRWRSRAPQACQQRNDAISLEDETAQLQKDLMVKERETLEILKELEATKRILYSLKLEIHKEETSKSIVSSTKNSDSTKVHPIADFEEHTQKSVGTSIAVMKAPPPCLILMELKQAKLNLNRSMSDLGSLLASIDTIKYELQEESLSLEKARQKADICTTLIPNLEKEIQQIRFVLQFINDAGAFNPENIPDISRKLHELRSESEQFKRMEDAAKCEVLKLTGDIKQTKASIETVGIRLHAARKMEAAARAAELSLKVEVNAVMNSEKSTANIEKSVDITLPIKEYNMLVQKAQEAEQSARKRIEAAAAQVEAATKSKMALLRMVDEVKADVKTRKKMLSEALIRVEVANRGKLVVEDVLRKWRSENGLRRCSVHNSPRFKNSITSHYRKDIKIREFNDLCLGMSIMDSSKTTLTPSFSIGQMLNRDFIGPQDFDSVTGECTRPKVSLGQMLNMNQGISSPEASGDSVAPKPKVKAKRRRFALIGFGFILRKSKNNTKRKKKRQASGMSK